MAKLPHGLNFRGYKQWFAWRPVSCAACDGLRWLRPVARRTKFGYVTYLCRHCFVRFRYHEFGLMGYG